MLPKVECVWVTALDDRVCDSCKALEGMRVDYGGAYTAVKRKKQMVSVMFPPLHPRCRCVATYEEKQEVIP